MLDRFIDKVRGQTEGVGAIVRFGWDAVATIAFSGVPVRLFVDQLFQCGVRALFTTVVTGFLVGAIMALQIQLQLRNFGAEGTVGGIATSVTIRNVGPVLIGFILVGKVGAMTTAVLGTMRVTDQIDALRVLGVSPIRVVIAPRLLAVTVASFLLLLVGLVISVVGGMAMAALSFDIDPMYYVGQIPKFVSSWSVFVGLFKSLVFGAALGLIACYRGYSVTGGVLGVGRSVRGAAVTSLVVIIVFDLLISLVAASVNKWVNY